MSTHEIAETDLPAKRDVRIEVEIEFGEEIPQADPRSRKRKGERINALFESAEVQGQGYLKNVSKSGVFVRADDLPRRGETVKVSFARGYGEWVRIEGEVCWTTADLDLDRPVRSGFGLRIEDPPPEFREFYRQLLEDDEAESG